MIEIELPPGFEIKACGGCMRPILWLANLDNGRTFAAVVDPDDRTRFELHGCRPLQAPATWRQLDHGDPPSAEYLAAKQALKSKSVTDEKEPTP